MPNPWEIYDALIDAIPEEVTLTTVNVGTQWTRGSSPDKKEIERESEAAFGERPFAQLRSAAKTKKLIFDAVESGDAGTIHRFLQRNEFPGALHKNFYPDEKELSGLKNLLLRFFYEAAEASIRGGFDPEEAETL